MPKSPLDEAIKIRTGKMCSTEVAALSNALLDDVEGLKEDSASARSPMKAQPELQRLDSSQKEKTSYKDLSNCVFFLTYAPSPLLVSSLGPHEV